MPKIERRYVGAMVKIEVDWFDRDKHPEFVAWADSRLGEGLASWAGGPGNTHHHNQDGDIFVAVNDDLQDGTDSDMPAEYWDKVVEAAAPVADPNLDLDVLVWIKPDPETC